MRIAVFEVEPWERTAFDPLRDEHELVFHGAPLTPENAETAAGAEAV